MGTTSSSFSQNMIHPSLLQHQQLSSNSLERPQTQFLPSQQSQNIPVSNFGKPIQMMIKSGS